MHRKHIHLSLKRADFSACYDGFFMPLSPLTSDKSVDELAQSFGPLSLEERLQILSESVSGRAVFTTSFGMEDQAITHAIFSHKIPIDTVTLDTGRLFAETYDLWAETQTRYGQTIKAFYPDTATVEELVHANGINAFYESVAARKACCHVRKVEPLARALAGASLWVTGIRADQNSARQAMAFVEADTDRGLYKANPLLDWDQAPLDRYIAEHKIPVNRLHAQGFPSIGCQPCTRAIQPGEHPRAGRWWWENEAGQAGDECGLHVGPDGRLVRTKPQPAAAQTPFETSGALVD
jgi:phosphoadenosine phosphosulfate reductase